MCLFYHFFYFLEDIGLLDHNDGTDLYALHFVFLPVIQSQLDIFRDGWANHPPRTEHHRTPIQLWTMGLHQMYQQNSQSVAARSLTEVGLSFV